MDIKKKNLIHMANNIRIISGRVIELQHNSDLQLECKKISHDLDQLAKELELISMSTYDDGK